MRYCLPFGHRSAFALCFAGVCNAALCAAALAQTAAVSPPPAAVAPRPTMGLRVPLTPPKKAPTTKKSASKPSGVHRSAELNEKARTFYANVWGVDKLQAHYTSSGNLIRFSYRVLTPKLAAPLGNHESTPELVGIRSNAVLHVPQMEKIGQLRQMSDGEAGKEYWMVFSNKGDLVKRGDEVSVIIGKFRADGLIVE